MSDNSYRVKPGTPEALFEEGQEYFWKTVIDTMMDGLVVVDVEGMILSVGAGEKRAVVKDDKVVVATVMTVTLTCDHRVVDGADAARFLVTLKERLEGGAFESDLGL